MYLFVCKDHIELCHIHDALVKCTSRVVTIPIYFKRNACPLDTRFENINLRITSPLKIYFKQFLQ